MTQATLYNHKGAREVTIDELSLIEAPPATDTWFPLKHSTVLDTVAETLTGSGFVLDAMQLSVARDNQRFFGTLRLKNRIAEGVSLAVGLRNSTDKSFPIGFCVGERVFVCDNLAFASEIVIARKHTRFGQTRFNEAVSQAVLGLHQYQITAAERIARLQQWELPAETADSLMLRAYETGIVGARLLPGVLKHWREPITDFAPRTGWSLLNAFTSALKERQRLSPQEAAMQTIRLQRLLAPPELPMQQGDN
jgi:hypothetical protein